MAKKEILGNGKCIICNNNAPNGLVCKDHWSGVKSYMKNHKFSDDTRIRKRYSNVKRKLVDETNADTKILLLIELIALAYIEDNQYIYSQDRDNLIDMIEEDIYDAIKSNTKQPAKIINRVSKSYDEKVIIGKDVEEESGDTRKRWEAGFRCKDGHYVRSKGEMLIDNFLYDKNLLHAYEKKPFLTEENEVDKKRTSDFYLPKGKIYIEFWGLETKSYKESRELKTVLYEKNKLKLIELEDSDIKNLEDILTLKLAKQGVRVDD